MHVLTESLAAIDAIPPSIITSFILGQNWVNKLQKGLNEGEMLISAVLALQREWDPTFRPGNVFNPPSENVAEKVYINTMGIHFGGNYSRLPGDAILSHPKVLQALAAGAELPFAPSLNKTALENISKIGCWVRVQFKSWVVCATDLIMHQPFVTYLEAAVEQLSVLKDAPWTSYGDMVNAQGQQREERLEDSSALRKLETWISQGYVYTWLRPGEAHEVRVEAMKVLAAQLCSCENVARFGINKYSSFLMGTSTDSVSVFLCFAQHQLIQMLLNSSFGPHSLAQEGCSQTSVAGLLIWPAW